MKFFTKLILISLSILLFTACSNETEKNRTLTISAAVSLKDAMEEIRNDYKRMHPELTIDFNFGGSGSLQQQISNGAPVDLFFSAAEDKFGTLVKEGHILVEDHMDLLSNELVLVVPKGETTVQNFNDLLKDEIQQISIGTPETVPAGKYAKESFEQMGLWDGLQNKMVYAKDVRQVLSYVETKNVEAGIVYQTDALSSDQVEIIATADSATHTPIIYPVGIVQESKQYDAAKDFYSYLQTDEAKEVFMKYGFITQ